MTDIRAEAVRVFPRRTNATPDDPLVFIGDPPLFRPDADEVHVSVAFTYDRAEGERLQKAWSAYYDKVLIGGPGMGDRGGDFTPGVYMKRGFVITSRGCPNHCWFCDVWKREGNIRELPITEGWIVTDDNLLACSENHINAVFGMFLTQPHRPIFQNLDPALMTPEIASEIIRIKTEMLFVAYDTPDDREPMVRCGEMLRDVGMKQNQMRCYVLIGYPGDTIELAERRLAETFNAGFLPFAMLYEDGSKSQSRDWKQFRRLWCRPAIYKAIMRSNV